MQLTKKYLESGAVVNFVQVGHRSDAIEYAVAGIAKIYDVNLEVLGKDALTAEMEESMKNWVVETLLQGAYLREYHLWEKDCRAYFPAAAKRNGEELAMRGAPFTDVVKDALVAFGVAVPTETLDAIERMRERVNVMKHAAGLELNHFISKIEYAEAIQALESFWDYLASCERISG